MYMARYIYNLDNDDTLHHIANCVTPNGFHKKKKRKTIGSCLSVPEQLQTRVAAFVLGNLYGMLAL